MSKRDQIRPGNVKRLLRIACFLTAAFLFLILPAADCYAEEKTVFRNEETGYCVIIDDQAELLSADDTAKLTEDMKPVTQFGNAAFVSVSENAGTAENFARKYCHSHFGTDSGMVFLIDMKNRKLYIFCDGAMEEQVGKAGAETITDNVYRDASAGEYYRCASSVFDQIVKLQKGQRIARPMKYIGNALIAMLLSMLFVFVIISRRSREAVSEKARMEGSSARVISVGTPDIRYRNSIKRTIESGSSGGGHSSGSSSSGSGSSSSGSGGGHSF